MQNINTVVFALVQMGFAVLLFCKALQFLPADVVIVITHHSHFSHNTDLCFMV